MPRRHRLPRTARLLDRAQFKAVFDARRSRGNSYFRVHYAASDAARLGIAVSRRVSKRAVDRNRIKRQVRETFRLWRDKLESLDYVVVARSAARDADRRVLKEQLEQLWQRFSDEP
ncbi:MAG: ribonuclease P protein component [Gammaproteobacteria bacterium]|jgi:ribonuclease P protein component|nr:ribonuclease P protein component [Gammaproteobacteria bacterium]